MSNKKQTGLIGAGSFGRAHARNYNDISDLVAICDSNLESAKNAALDFEDVRVYNDVDKMLREENRNLETKGVNASELIKDNEMYKMKIAELEREIKEYKRNQEPYEAEKAKSEKVTSVTNASDIVPKKPSEVIKEQVLGVSESTAATRRKCPNCGNSNPASIHEKVDKTRIIMESPRMYGKKYICGECGIEWI